jgi:hypothetical protein
VGFFLYLASMVSAHCLSLLIITRRLMVLEKERPVAFAYMVDYQVFFCFFSWFVFASFSSRSIGARTSALYGRQHVWRSGLSSHSRIMGYDHQKQSILSSIEQDSYEQSFQ